MNIFIHSISLEYEGLWPLSIFHIIFIYITDDPVDTCNMGWWKLQWAIFLHAGFDLSVAYCSLISLKWTLSVSEIQIETCSGKSDGILGNQLVRLALVH